MASNSDDFHTGKTGLLCHLRKKVADDRCGLYQLTEDIGAKTCSLDEVEIPIAGLCIQKLASAGHRVLVVFLSGQKISEELWHKEQTVCFLIDVRTHFLIRIELENCVEVHELDTGGSIDLF